jgi:hypothetical protein
MIEQIVPDDGTMSLSSFWNLVLFINNILCIFSNLIIFFREFLSESHSNESFDFLITVVLAFACLTSWIKVLYVLSLFERIDIVNKTLRNASSTIFYFTLGVSPIFLSFVFAGFCMFHEADRFVDLKSSYITLMTLFAADEYQSNYNDTEDYRLNIVFFTLYGFVILKLVANVFVFLIESGYEKEIRDGQKRKSAKQ